MLSTIRFTIAFLALTACSATLAHDFTCRNGSVERMISVQHEVDGQEVPCVVKYDKPSEGGTEFPYRAQNEIGYCEEKAEYLVQRLGSFGWDCARTDSVTESAESVAVPETDH